MKVVQSLSTSMFRIVNLFLPLDAYVDSCIQDSNVSEFVKRKKLEDTCQNTAVFNLRHNFFCTIAKTKQTMRRSTGSKAPRRLLALKVARKSKPSSPND